MLSKLFKYDFKAVFKYWWIAAVSSFGLSLIGGVCWSWTTTGRELPSFFRYSIYQIIVIAFLGLMVISFLSFILVNARFYKNFFTDEGYLTFTLPVKRYDLLNSKLLLGTTFSLITTVLIIADIILLLSIPYPGAATTVLKGIFEMFFSFDYSFTEILYSVVYIVEFIAIFLLSTLLSTQFIYACLTVASIVVKKARILVTIGIYYGGNSVMTFITQMFIIFGVPSLIKWLVKTPTEYHDLTVALIMLGIIAFLVIMCALLYAFEYWLLDRKLNLY